MEGVVALVAGVLFGFGLLLSGMSDPANVLGFLDVAGRWNPALAFVMGGAIGVAAPAFAWVRRRGATLASRTVLLPDRRRIDARLLGGSAVFGVGWGLAGFCPGPAVLTVGRGSFYAVVFVLAMLCGLLIAAGSGSRAGARAPATSIAPGDDVLAGFE